mgnify:FL=1
MTENSEKSIYRELQKHLDSQPVGFPSVKSGANIRFLKRMFSPREALLAQHLSWKYAGISHVMKTAVDDFKEEEAVELLQGLSMKGAIGFREKGGETQWCLLPMIIGMYEAMDGIPDPEFIRDAQDYMNTLTFGKSLLAAQPSQMRTIPINESLPVEHVVADYSSIESLIRKSPGPFVVLPCICREGRKLKGQECDVTSRVETCLGMGDTAKMVLARGHGREIDRDEALKILGQNQEDGLVLQPGNARDPEFICSCCCGMLQLQKMIPRPVDFWTSHYRAEVTEDKCVGCGKCAQRCQVNAVTVKEKLKKAVISRSRCIGCGICVAACPAEAVRLVPLEDQDPPPGDSEELLETIMQNKKNGLERLVMTAKLILGMRQ